MILKSLHHFFMLSFLRGQRLWWQREENQVKGKGQEERTSLDVPDKSGKGLKKQEERYDSAVHGFALFSTVETPFQLCFIFFWCLLTVTVKNHIQSAIFTTVAQAAAKSDSDDSEEETKSTKSKKKSTASSASMFQTTGDKDKDKKTKKKGRFTRNCVFFCLVTEQHLTITVVVLRQGRGERWFRVRERGKIKEEKGQRKEEKGEKSVTFYCKRLKVPF